jgi:hypothetical protein
LLLTKEAIADEQPYLIDRSRSPDGKIELWVKPKSGEGIAAGVAEIRQVKTGKILGKFEWSGFGVRLAAPDPPFEVFWRNDSQYFAIRYEFARGWMTGGIYGRGIGSRWIEVKMPSDRYTNAIKKMSGVSELYGKGCDRPIEWTTNRELVLEFADRNLLYEPELEKEYLVTLKVEDWLGRPLRTAGIVSIKQKSKEEVEREYQAR